MDDGAGVAHAVIRIGRIRGHEVDTCLDGPSGNVLDVFSGMGMETYEEEKIGGTCRGGKTPDAINNAA
jgi:hypothetical protein